MIGDDDSTSHFALPREAVFAYSLFPVLSNLVRSFRKEVSGITAPPFASPRCAGRDEPRPASRWGLSGCRPRAENMFARPKWPRWSRKRPLGRTCLSDRACRLMTPREPWRNFGISASVSCEVILIRQISPSVPMQSQAQKRSQSKKGGGRVDNHVGRDGLEIRPQPAFGLKAITEFRLIQETDNSW